MQSELLATLKYFLLDMDGTLYLGGSPLPGATEFIRYLRESGRKYLFFTNNCSNDSIYYAKKLANMGIEASSGDVLTSGEAMARFLAMETPFRTVFTLGTPSFETELSAAGISIAGVGGDADAVVLAFDKTLTYAKLEQACLLLRKGLPYYATNPDKVCPTEYGYIPDCGSMAALLYEATGRHPKYIGKPNPEMIRMGLDKLSAHPAATAMVGDRLYTDMQMAFNAGITSILVMSGETSQADLDRLERKPDFIFQTVGELSEALKACDAQPGKHA